MSERKPTVVVLDDSEVCLEVASEKLEEAGFEVITASSGLGASRLLHNTRPDCVVVDVGMPALSGDKLVEILRRNVAKEVPILLHSDRPKGELLALARTCGATDAVVKTSDCRGLVDAVKRHVASRVC